MIVKYKNQAVNLLNVSSLRHEEKDIVFWFLERNFLSFEFENKETAEKIFSVILENYGKHIKFLDLRENDQIS